MDSDGAWEPGTAVTISVNDPDANKNPTSTETLAIGDETHVIPTIIMGSPLTLAQSGTNSAIAKNSANSTTGVVVGADGSDAASTLSSGTVLDLGQYGLNITNTTDNSERLRIMHSGVIIDYSSGISAAESATHLAATLSTNVWINVTTGHTRATLVDLPGTVVLNYDVSGPCSLITCTSVKVYVVDSGDNGSNNSAGVIDVNTTGNDVAGVYDLDD
jgi:hypothetical protein